MIHTARAHSQTTHLSTGAQLAEEQTLLGVWQLTSGQGCRHSRSSDPAGLDHGPAGGRHYMLHLFGSCRVHCKLWHSLT